MSRLARLIAFVSLWLLLAACGGDGPDTELTTIDSAIEQEVEPSEPEELRVDAGSADSRDELEVEPPIVPDAPAVTSPAGRQDAQSVGGVDLEADAAVDNGELESAAGSGLVVGQASESSGEQAEQASVAPAPIGPVIDIPIPSQTGSDNVDNSDGADSEPAAPFVSAAGSSEDSSAELGGLEPDAVDAGVPEPDSAGDGVAVAELQPEPVPAELSNGDADRICPEGAASDCASDAEALLVDDVATNDTFGDEDPAALEEPDCEARPWMVGCDGPVPEPGDYEPQRTVESQEVDESAGVQVPQEIQDLLLAPIDE